MADVIEITGPGGAVEQRWDDGPRLYTDFRPNPDFVRAYTVAENADADARLEQATEEANSADLLAKAKAAVSNNLTFLAIASPTNAQNAAQLKALTRQVNALIKLTVRDLATTDGT